jgi:hypothetical protein
MASAFLDRLSPQLMDKLSMMQWHEVEAVLVAFVGKPNTPEVHAQIALRLAAIVELPGLIQ